MSDLTNASANQALKKFRQVFAWISMNVLSKRAMQMQNVSIHRDHIRKNYRIIIFCQVLIEVDMTNKEFV